ncbi:hypothetical protein RCL_jg27312.t1 [Rhizophagus clarus]|uniref:Uncharacterized protein n=1 Tax=Rhizophagus clarus TaxID=94130 RepID=A0A8H3LXN4_9GLOM|nr:hypothetical protein RCL_jg27312.t1 [Rhizophagus clarus]
MRTKLFSSSEMVRSKGRAATHYPFTWIQSGYIQIIVNIRVRELQTDDLENTDYNNVNTVFEALWYDSNNMDNIDKVVYKFCTDTNGQCRKKNEIDV